MMTEKKNLVTTKTQKASKGALPGLQLHLFPEVNDMDSVCRWFSKLWRIRRQSNPVQDEQLQSLAKQEIELQQKLIVLYKTQEEMQADMSDSRDKYWYNNIESRDLEPEEEEIPLQKQINETNNSLRIVKNQKKLLIDKLYPEHKIYLDLLQQHKTKSM